jgi:Zn-dependent M32 family carboxypeptidase
MRGQLIDSPGYMLNYALGAMVAADVRARIREQRGGFTSPNPGLYDRLARGLYRFGREKSSREVLEDFLGRPLSARALLEDLARR